MSTAPDDRTQEQPVYVGYLPLPRALRSSTLLAALVVFVWGGMAAALLTLTQPDPGEAVWDTAREQSFTGLLLAEPYPMLVTPDETLLVVGIGKVDARAPLTGHFGTQVTLRGYTLTRSGRRMIELSSVAAPPPDHRPIAQPRLEVLAEEPRTYHGEIIDGKCYLGAMKPGDGFAHRSCAVLCIQGGLPPMLAREGRSPDDDIPLLVFDGQGVLPDRLIHAVASPIALRGTPARIGTLSVLIVDPGSVSVLFGGG